MKLLKVNLTDVETGKRYHFKSAFPACNFLNQNASYIYYHFRRGNKFVYSLDEQGNRDRKYKLSARLAEREAEPKPYTQLRQPQLCCYCSNCNDHSCLFIKSHGVLPIIGGKFEADYCNGGVGYHIIECPNFYPDSCVIKGFSRLLPSDLSTLEPYMGIVNKLVSEGALQT